MCEMQCAGQRQAPVIDFEQSAVFRNDKLVSLTPIELELLRYLVAHGNTTVTREELMRNVWGRKPSSARTVDMHVASLRRKLEANSRRPQYILTVRGVGYEFRNAVVQSYGTNR
jgi:DNA-binding response OmpR family regulator